MLARHQERIDAYRNAHPGVPAHSIGSLSEVEQSRIAGQHARRAYAELRALLGKQYERLAPKVRAQLAVLAEDAEAGL